MLFLNKNRKPPSNDAVARTLDTCGAVGVLDLAALGALAAAGLAVEPDAPAWRLEAKRRWGTAARRPLEVRAGYGRRHDRVWSWRELVEFGERRLGRLFHCSGGVRVALETLTECGALPYPLPHAALAATLRAASRHKPGRQIALYVTSDVIGERADPNNDLPNRRDAVGAVVRAFAPRTPVECPEAALRQYLAALPFLPVSSGRGADRLMRAIAREHEAATPAWSADSVYIMMYALIMLNTDLHNPRVRPKMSEDDFVRSLHGTAMPELLLPDRRARRYYRSIKSNPLGAEVKPAPAVEVWREPWWGRFAPDSGMTLLAIFLAPVFVNLYFLFADTPIRTHMRKTLSASFRLY